MQYLHILKKENEIKETQENLNNLEKSNYELDLEDVWNHKLKPRLLEKSTETNKFDIREENNYIKLEYKQYWGRFLTNTLQAGVNIVTCDMFGLTLFWCSCFYMLNYKLVLSL